MKAIAAALLVLAAALLAGCPEPPAPPQPQSGAATGIARDVLQKAKANAGAYPLDTCVVSGEKLGQMGDPIVFTHEGVEVRLCCPDCRKDFDKDPEKFLAMIRAGKPGK